MVGVGWLLYEDSGTRHFQAKTFYHVTLSRCIEAYSSSTFSTNAEFITDISGLCTHDIVALVTMQQHHAEIAKAKVLNDLGQREQHIKESKHDTLTKARWEQEEEGRKEKRGAE